MAGMGSKQRSKVEGTVDGWNWSTVMGDGKVCGVTNLVPWSVGGFRLSVGNVPGRTPPPPEKRARQDKVTRTRTSCCTSDCFPVQP